MTLSQRYAIILIFLMLCSLFAYGRSAQAQSIWHLKLDARRVPWTDFSFHGKHSLVEVSTDIQVRSLRAADLEAVLPRSPTGNPIKPVAPEAAQMTIHTTIAPTFRSPVYLYNRIWFNPADASALGRIRLRRGEDDFKKIYRFTDQGVFRHRMEPKDKVEASLDPAKWTDTDKVFYPYDQTQLNCSAVTERSLLIYILSAAAAIKFKEPLSLCVFGKRQLHRVQLKNHGTQPITVNYIEKKQQSVVQKQISIKALKFEITSKPLKSNLEEDENFSFFGLHKDILIYIDPTSGLPVQASGIITGVGQAHLKLRAVSLRQNPS